MCAHRKKCQIALSKLAYCLEKGVTKEPSKLVTRANKKAALQEKPALNRLMIKWQFAKMHEHSLHQVHTGRNTDDACGQPSWKSTAMETTFHADRHRTKPNSNRWKEAP